MFEHLKATETPVVLPNLINDMDSFKRGMSLGRDAQFAKVEPVLEALVEACTNVTRVLQTEVVLKYLDIGVILTDEQWDKVGAAWAAIKNAQGKETRDE